MDGKAVKDRLEGRVRRSPLRCSWRCIRRLIISRPVTALVVLLVAVYVGAVLLIMVSEQVNFTRATTMILPAFLGELGMVDTHSLVTQIGLLLALLVSIAFLAVVTGKIAGGFVEFCRRGGIIVKEVNISNHILICGWNFQGEKIVEELLHSEVKPRPQVVILADRDKRPLVDERVEFVRGDPTQDEALIRAGIKRAHSAIILSDLDKSANETDAAALMITLAVESLNRDVHSCVQIVNSANKPHFERAHADEIICLDQIGGNLVVASALNHGTSRLVSELLTFDAGSEFYRYDAHLSDEIVGKEFGELVGLLAKRRMLLLAVETDDSQSLRAQLRNDMIHSIEDLQRVIVVNPQNKYRLQQGDALFVIAESAPQQI